jgi:hypothetical protein
MPNPKAGFWNAYAPKHVVLISELVDHQYDKNGRIDLASAGQATNSSGR